MTAEREPLDWREPSAWREPPDVREPSDVREPMHQPPNPADLRRAPPGSPECARVRGLLRDYADGDLAGDGDLARRVEEHVHLCRVCALELARAEHEVFQLRRQFWRLRDASPPAERGPRPGFARRVVERLVRDETSVGMPFEAGGGAAADAADASGERRADSDGGRRSAQASAGGPVVAPAGGLVRGAPGGGLRGAVGSGAVGSGAVGSGAVGSGAVGSPLGMLIISMVLLVGLGIGVRCLATANDAPAHIARLVVLRADGTFDGRRQPLGGGDILGELQSLHVVRGGEARIDWHDPSERRQPAATLQVEGGEMRLENGAPMLVNGKVLVETNRDVDMPMADGSRLELGVGEYVIAAEIPADMLADEPLAPGEDPLSFLPGDLRIQVEVRSGEPARIVRVGTQLVQVTAGQVGIYRGNSGVAVHTAGDATNTIDSGDTRVVAENSAPAQPLFSGLVVDAVGLPSVGAEVFVGIASQGHKLTLGALTAADGRFVMQTGGPCDGGFAIVLARPAFAVVNLGIAVPQALPVEQHGDNTDLVRPIRFEQSMPLHGVVRDEANQLRTGVQVIPCIVDELFGSVLALLTNVTYTDSLGTFHIDRLPARLPAHESMVLLFSHPALEPTVVPVPVRGSVVATPEFGTYHARQLRTISIGELPPNAASTVFEEVPGLPPGTAVVRRRVIANGSGDAGETPVGRGVLWLRSGPPNSPTVRRLELTGIGPIPHYEPAGPAYPAEQQFRPLRPLSDSAIEVQHTYRHERFVTSQIANAVAGQSLRVVDGWGHGLPEAQVFSIEATGPRGAPDTLFLGFTSLVGGLSLAGLSPTASIVVIGTNGEAAVVDRPTALDPVVELLLQPTGRVLLHPSLRPPSAATTVVPIRFRMDEGLPGLQPVAVRFAGAANGWEVADLAPGRYVADVNGIARTVQVPSGGFVVLQ